MLFTIEIISCCLGIVFMICLNNCKRWISGIIVIPLLICSLASFGINQLILCSSKIIEEKNVNNVYELVSINNTYEEDNEENSNLYIISTPNKIYFRPSTLTAPSAVETIYRRNDSIEFVEQDIPVIIEYTVCRTHDLTSSERFWCFSEINEKSTHYQICVPKSAVIYIDTQFNEN